jgi:predicted TIM-barrel fold metal-dependent hydrolase
MPIIDVDTHWTEPPDLWTSRAPAHLRDRVLRIGNDADANRRWIAESDIVFAPPGFTVIRKDGSKVHDRFTLEDFDEMSEAAIHPEARLDFMDEHGVHAQVVYPNALGFGGAVAMRIEDEELRLFLITAYNDAAADFQAAGRGRLFPQAVLPFWDIDLAVNELHRCREKLGLTGLAAMDSPHEWGLPSLNDPHWDPMWAAAQDLDMPVNFHIGSGGGAVGRPVWDGFDLGRMMAVTSVQMIMGNLRCITNLIFSGLLDRYPRLNFVSVESGVGWLPFLIEACDYQMRENMPAGASGLKLSPREYFERQIYASYWFENDCVAPAIEALGDDNIMFETDFPHPTCLHPGVREHVVRSLGALEPQTQRKVLHETAARLYDIPLPY